LRRAATVGQGVVSMASSTLANRAPRSSLNGRPGPHRRFAIQRLALDDVKRIKNAFGTTVNDVVLALTADATGRYLHAQGANIDGMWLKAMVPVSVRSGDDDALGNQVTSVFVSLPVMPMDPVERLEVCHGAMSEVKEQHHAVGAGFLLGLTTYAPPTIHAMASRVAARGRLYNFLITNVPGPQMPIYCLGARLLGAFPFTPLSGSQTYAVGVTSIDGWLNFGFTADYDTHPDIESVTPYLRAALDDLLASAAAAAAHHELAVQRTPDGRASGA
jgi:diacylglycerol O-acyltransferase / wax synthase